MTKPIFAGVDVGGTNTKTGLVDDDGEIIAHTSFSTEQEQGPAFALRKASETINQLLKDAGFERSELKAVGLATPGPMDITNGMVLTPFNMSGWRNFSVRDKLAELTERPVSFTNDANAAALGEFWIGSGRNYSSIILVTLGTGIGGGIIIDDRAIVGAHSHGAEIGHSIIDSSESARVCGCGHPGHLEAYASATAVVKRCQEQLDDGVKSNLTAAITPTSPLSAKMISGAAEAGDQLACNVISETAHYLALGIASLAHVIDPEAVLLGGAMTFGGSATKTGADFLEQIRSNVKNCSLPIIAERLTIEFAALAGNAGFVGAASLARSDYQLSRSQAKAS